MTESVPPTTMVTTFADGETNDGVATFAAAIVNKMISRGFPIAVCAARTPSAAPDAPNVHREWRVGRPLTLLRAVRRLTSAVVHLQHEVFLYGGALSALLVPFAIRFYARAPLVVTIHGVVSKDDITPDFCKRNGFGRVHPSFVKWVFAFIYRSLNRAATRIIVHERVFSDRLAENWSCRTPVTVVPLPLPQLPPPSTRVSAEERFKLERGPVVAFLGYFANYKGLEELIAAWPLVRSQRPDAQLLVGAGPHPKKLADQEYMKSYRAIADAAAALPGVRWHGYVDGDELGTFFGAVDLLVLPYRELLSASGPLHIAVGYETRVLCSSVLAPVLPADVACTPTDPASLANAIAAELSQPVAEGLRAWKRERSLDATVDAHARVYSAAAAGD